MYCMPVSKDDAVLAEREQINTIRILELGLMFSGPCIILIVE